MQVLERLGVLTDEVSSNFEEALDWAAAQELRHVEVRMVDGRNIVEYGKDEVLKLRDQVHSRGLFVSCIASPLFKCALDPARKVAQGDTFGQKEESVEAHFNKLASVIETAKLLGSNRIRIFSFWREGQPLLYRGEIETHLRRAADIAQQEGVQLLLENEPACNGGYAMETAEIVRAVGSSALRALWDPGNDAYAGVESFPAGYSAVKDVLAHVHLKDAYIAADGKSRCVPLGSGNVPLLSVLRQLASDQYEGLFTIETHFVPQGGSPMTGTRMSLHSLRALLEDF